MFDVDKFIECVREYPAIWDKRSKEYKDKNKKQQSWLLIGEIMYDTWEDMKELKRQELGKN